MMGGEAATAGRGREQPHSEPTPVPIVGRGVNEYYIVKWKVFSTSKFSR